MRKLVVLFLILSLFAGCARVQPIPTAQPTPTATPPSPTPTPQTEEPPLYLAIIWHQHQPFYYKDPETGVYTRPWVRVHATKDYYDMAAILEQYPNVKVTFNLTPSLIRQLDDFSNGAKDLYWVLTEKPADELTDDEKRFILQRFFDANWDHIIARFPRYEELLNKRGRSSDEATIEEALQKFSTQDFRDLQVWFNLAWFDPDFLAEEPLKSLVEKGEGFTEEDKQIIFDKVREVIQAVIPKHKELQDNGQIEVITTPYAHPILPLLYDTNLAAVGDPGAELPQRFSFPNDAIAQLQKAVEIYESHFGRKPKGLWPSEGSVAQEIVKLVSDAGFLWMASGEDVLASSLGIDTFARDSAETVKEADALYRPYYVRYQDQPPVAILFRDKTISDKIGFTYSGMPGKQAAADLIQRLRNIKTQLDATGTPGPHLVTIVVDGENAWEWYDNDGKEFFHALYQGLSEAEDIETITPSEYLERYPDQKDLEHLWAGCWFSPDFTTWIGEPEENTAWEYLLKVRNFVAEYDLYKRRTAPEEDLNRALEFLYRAEGSDWFWWYGSDQDSGQDEYFDYAFRSLLKEVYQSLGEEPPAFLDAPIIPRQATMPTKGTDQPFTPTIDGTATEEEWASAGYYKTSEDSPIPTVYYGFDAKHLYVRVDSSTPWETLGPDAYLGVYLSSPTTASASPFSRQSMESDFHTFLGFRATHLAEAQIASGNLAGATLFQADQKGNWIESSPLDQIALGANSLELALPLETLGELDAGDILNLIVVLSANGADLALTPSEGPLQIVLPEVQPITVLLEVNDPEKDDHGPGTYTYALDPVFAPQAFDLQSFIVGEDEENIVFRFTLYGPIPNPWGSPINLSLQTFDVYIDIDPGTGTGRRLLLPGRNAALAEGYGWEYAIWIEGWGQQIWTTDKAGELKQVKATPKVVVNPEKQTVTIRVPKATFGEHVDPSNWAYVGVVLSQEGYPSAGVWRVRDIEPQAQQWKMGGAPNDTNHTRILDLAWPAENTPTQEEILGTYSPSQETNMDQLNADDFCQLPMLKP